MFARFSRARLALWTATMLGLLVFSAGCAKQAASPTPAGSGDGQPAPAAEQADKQADAPTYSKWIVYINDDDSFTQSGITYKIALNLNASHAGADPSGKYTGSATAKTDSTGQYRGQQLNASAIAKSSKLVFTLDDPSGGGALASLGTGELPPLSGTGTISMSASGSGSYGAAGGSFGKSSSEPLTLSSDGEKITLKVSIQGHTYTFTGTIRGEE